MNKRLAAFSVVVSSFVLLFSFQNFTVPEDLYWGRSLMIRQPELMDRLNADYDFGGQLGELNTWLLNEKPGRRPRDKENPGAFVSQIFELAVREQKEHEAQPAAKRLGGDMWPDRRLDAVFRNWKSPDELSKVTKPAGLKGGPFRMLAVVNLLDRAGDAVATSVSVATSTPKSLGELHIVYGLVDKDHEKRTGEAFPQTFVLAYKLPPLMWEQGKLVPDPRVTHEALMAGDEVWRNKLYLWANLWARLSNFEPGTAEHEAGLRNILRLAAQPENFLSVRSNTKVNAAEFELREWYVIGSTQSLIPKRPRDETYRCFGRGNKLARLVDRYWRPDYGDLDVTSYDPTKKVRNADYAGYDLPRDNKEGFFRDEWDIPECGKRRSDLPFDMHSEGNGTVPGERILFQAPFGRTKLGQIWDLGPGVPELRRHAFAIRSCTGCHSSEGAAKGFHIFPRLAQEKSKLSGFLQGGNFGEVNTFTHGGQAYRYNILAARKDFLMKAADPNVKVRIGEGLLRPEMPH